LAPYGFAHLLAVGGFAAAMAALAAAVFLVGLGAALLVARSGAVFAAIGAEPATPGGSGPGFVAIWLAYGSGVFAGLMAIGHAAGIAVAAGLSGWKAIAVIAICNLVGSLLAGVLSDRDPQRRMLILLPLLGAAALLLLVFVPGLTLLGLGLVGFAYGGTIAAYPVAIATFFPGESGPRVYGRVFTAWGLAGLAAPWLAGRLFDASGSYGVALCSAALLGLCSAVTARRFLRRV
ncbi:MAG: MFS transporter, partial [Paracoccaceae bacterium]